MDLPKNRFKQGLGEGRQQLGTWSAIRDPAAIEMLAGCGFDWITLDCEHAPNDLDRILTLLQAMAPYDCAPVVRPSCLDAAEIKRLLDIGAQTLLVPYVQTAEEARQAAAAVAYPPEGIRGVAGITRASRFGTVPDYITRARDEICLIVQIETRTALDNLEEIAAVPGIDALFIGPADLAASLGHDGDQHHPEVRATITDAIARICRAGKPAGFLSVNDEALAEVVAAGSTFTAIDIDIMMLQRTARARLASLAHLRG
jgi:4-hydroxy-2-oxoheptanedioate aldolase